MAQANLERSTEVTFLRLPEVIAMTVLSKSSLYALIRAEQFPSAVNLGLRTVGWVRSEVNQWAEDRVHLSRSGRTAVKGKRPSQRVQGTAFVLSRRSA